jgi:hypothetical protein
MYKDIYFLFNFPFDEKYGDYENIHSPLQLYEYILCDIYSFYHLFFRDVRKKHSIT